MKAAVITIGPTITDINLKTGDIGKLDIVDALIALARLLSQQMIEEAVLHVGNDKKAIEKWLDAQRQKPNEN